MASIRLGVIGAGNIAAAFVKDSKACELVEVFAIASRTQEKADAFAARFSLAKSYGNYQALLGDPEVDAVYIATPNGEHKPWTIQAARAGKHILCEKPLALTVLDARDMFAVAREHGVKLIEAFPFRFQPQTIAVLERIGAGDIGEVVAYSGCFGFPMTDPNNVRLDPNQGGGSIWDVGVYPINLARAVFGKSPAKLTTAGKIHPNGMDESATVLFEYDDGRSASIWCSFNTPPIRRAQIAGSKGFIEYPHANHTADPESASFTIGIAGKSSERILCEPGNGFALEADAFAKLIQGNESSFHGTTEQETIENTATCVAAIESLRIGQKIKVTI
jgi:predicted dehydrogenase